jgi:hypothetical protein
MPAGACFFWNVRGVTRISNNLGAGHLPEGTPYASIDILEISCRSYKQGPRYPRYDYFEHVLQRNLLALLYQQGAPDSGIYVAETHIYIYICD